MKSVDDLFKTSENLQADAREKVVYVPLSEMHYFKNHPFKVLDDEKMLDTIESIKQYGVLSPGLVRLSADGSFEIVSGHRRHHACELAGLTEMPVIVRDITDDEAIIIMVDSNLQRETLLPSEKAFAYKMKLDAMKRQAGRPSKQNLSQVGTQKRSDQILAEQTGESRNQIQRYIRLTELMPELIQMVDDKTIAFSPAVELSYLTKQEQEMLLEVMERDESAPTLAQATKLKNQSQEGKLTSEVMDLIMHDDKPFETKLTFKDKEISKYFPSHYSTDQKMKYIF